AFATDSFPIMNQTKMFVLFTPFCQRSRLGTSHLNFFIESPYYRRIYLVLYTTFNEPVRWYFEGKKSAPIDSTIACASRPVSTLCVNPEHFPSTLNAI
ncbi:MAG: hypothetical protein WBP96_00795, partial [Nitrososphaeraceae archaeon]